VKRRHLPRQHLYQQDHERIGSPFDDPFFRQFFGDQFDFGRSRERVQNSLGSGVIVAEDGLVVTNNHVIEGPTGPRRAQ
jgi:S1-C subfamily serine protease